jgi:DNA-binding GntR family transcriptional regulator
MQAEKAYLGVRELIINVNLRPGSTILEKELQERLQVGRTPLREALHRLAQEHMVHIYPRRAIVVAKFDLADIRQLFEMREAVESSAAALAAQRTTAAQLDHLRCILEAMDQAGRDFDPIKFLDLDRSFHLAIACYSGSRFVRSATDHVLSLNRWIWNSYFSSDRKIDVKFLDHYSIMHAIEKNDGAEAASVMKAHVHQSLEQLLRQF